MTRQGVAQMLRPPAGPAGLVSPFFCRWIAASSRRIRIEIVSNFHADAALTLRKKRGFSVCSVAGSRSRDYQSNPHFQCGFALTWRNSAFPFETQSVSKGNAMRKPGVPGSDARHAFLYGFGLGRSRATPCGARRLTVWTSKVFGEMGGVGGRPPLFTKGAFPPRKNHSSSTLRGRPGASRTTPSTTTRSPSLRSPSTTLVPSCSKRTRTLRSTAVSSGPAR